MVKQYPKILFEEMIVLNRIIYPYNIEENTLTQYEAFERVRKHISITNFKSKIARTIWMRLEQLYKDKMPFCDMFFEFDALGSIWATSGVKDITPHIKLLKEVPRG